MGYTQNEAKKIIADIKKEIIKSIKNDADRQVVDNYINFIELVKKNTIKKNKKKSVKKSKVGECDIVIEDKDSVESQGSVE